MQGTIAGKGIFLNDPHCCSEGQPQTPSPWHGTYIRTVPGMEGKKQKAPVKPKAAFNTCYINKGFDVQSIYIYISLYIYLYLYIYIVNIQLWVHLHHQVQPVDPTASRRHAAQESLGVGSWRVCLSHRRCDRAHRFIHKRRGRLAWLLVLLALTSPFCCDLTAPVLRQSVTSSRDK